MRYAIYDTTTGDILRIGDAPEELLELQALSGEGLYEGEATLADAINPVTGDLIPNGKVIDYSVIRADKKAQIENERDRRIYEVITVGALDLEATKRSQDNVSARLASIASRESIEAADMAEYLLVWRDADNVTHSWETQADYKAFLQSFAIAMEERGTLAYGWSWAKKTALDATDDENLAEFDPTV